MTWTFVSAASSRKDAVRVLVGDTDTSDQQLADEDINYYVGLSASDFLVAAYVCQALAGKYAREAQNALPGPVSEYAQQRWEHYLAMSNRYWQIALTGAPSSVGGAGTAVPFDASAAIAPFFTRALPPGTGVVDATLAPATQVPQP